MEKTDVKNLLDSKSYEELKELRKETSKRLSNIKKKDRLFFSIYIQKEYRKDFEQALDWLYRNKLIKKRSKWAFAKFAIINAIGLISEQLKSEQGK